MYLLYMDESGDPGQFTKGQNTFVLGGLAVHEGQVRILTDRMNAMQEAFFPGIKLAIPFHATELRAGKGCFDKMPAEKRNKIFDAIYDIISSMRFPYLLTFATAIDISSVENP